MDRPLGAVESGTHDPAEGKRSNVTRGQHRGFIVHARGKVDVEPRGLSMAQSAAYVGVSPSLFDEMVQDGRMPPPKRFNGRTVWDRKQLDEAFDASPSEHRNNPWDDKAH